MRHIQAAPRVTAIVPLLLALSSWADEFDDELARQDALERQADAVNEGSLKFLARPPEGPPVHHQHNRILFTRDSLQNGFVRFQQCHENLDVVADTEIMFDPRRVSDLRVESYANIATVTVDGTRVRLGNVGAGARLCLTARSRALHREDNGQYVLRNGPFMRRFLDGYYPLHLTMEVLWPAQDLRFVGATPTLQPGFDVANQGNSLRLDAWFEGRLVTELRFGPV